MILLHATLKKLDNNLDFTDIIRPLLADTGPAVAHVPKLAKQIAHMKKMIEDTGNVRQEEEEKARADFLRQSPAQTSGVCNSAGPLYPIQTCTGFPREVQILREADRMRKKSRLRCS